MDKLPDGYQICNAAGCNGATDHASGYCRAHRAGQLEDQSIDKARELLDEAFSVTSSYRRGDQNLSVGPKSLVVDQRTRPIPWARFRTKRYGKYIAWRNELKGLLERILVRDGRPFANDANVMVEVIVSPDGLRFSVSEIVGSRGDLRGDADNYLKGVGDALQEAGVIVDDRQILSATVRIIANE